MKLRSFLLGATAILLTANSAKAADAIVVEAEPLEYVKVCDMYGSGYFYIPGTETCLNIRGYVRSTYTHARDERGFFDTELGRGEYNTSSWTYRGRLQFDVRNETEFGTLGSNLRFQGGDSDASDDVNVGIDQALVTLGGFRLGYSNTYFTANHDYGADSLAINDGYYDDDQAIFFDYTAMLMDGVSVTVGVQDSEGGAIGAASPDFYAGINASIGGLTLAASAIRDDVAGGDDDWAYKGSAIMALGEGSWSFGGWYAWDNGNTQYVTGYLDNSVEKEWGVQLNGALTGNFSIYGLYSEAHGELPAGFVTYSSTDLQQWAAGIVWAPVGGLAIQVEYAASESKADLTGDGGAVLDSDADGLSVRVTRSF